MYIFDKVQKIYVKKIFFIDGHEYLSNNMKSINNLKIHLLILYYVLLN